MKKTIQNLTKAFIGESQARNRYKFFASIAKKEGYEQIAGIFLETSDQEKEHGKRIYEYINELKEKSEEKFDSITVEAEAPIVLGSTSENLKAAVGGEKHEFETMYPEFAKIAEEEGLEEIAANLKAIAIAEKHHMERYQKLLGQVDAGTVFKKEEKVYWVCRECGYVHYGQEAPEECPSCKHAQAFYQRQCEEY